MLPWPVVMSTYTCPLCHQPVSKALYDKITGIWQERTRQLEHIKAERKKFRDEISEERQRLTERIRQFKAEKARLVREAVERRTRALEGKIEILRAKERQIEANARRQIDRATKAAHREAHLLMKSQLLQFKNELRASTTAKVKEVMNQVRLTVERKYQHLQYSFNSAISQMKSQDTKMQQQQERIRELERELKRQTTPSVEGLLYEKTLLKELRKKFPKDEFLHTGKGGDIIQYVMQKGERTGTVVYECKRVKNYSSRHLTQALEAKVKRKADFAILVTSAMKKGTQGFFAEKEVLIVHPAGVLALISVLRTQIVRIADLRLGQLERDKAVRQTLNYLQGAEFSNSMEGIIVETISLHKELTDEIKKHFAVWKRRYDSYAKIHTEAYKVKSTTNAMLSGEAESKPIQQAPYPALVQLSKSGE